MVYKLKPNQIFVFGSNLAGEHIGGAARQAYENFGAEWLRGEGLTGQSYAFPTLDENFEKRTDEELKESVRKFYQCVKENPDKEFLLTAVGTGIAGYDEDYMNELFKDLPATVVKLEKE